MNRYWKYLALGFLGLAIVVPGCFGAPTRFRRRVLRPRILWTGDYAGMGRNITGGMAPGIMARTLWRPAPNVGKVKIETKMKGCACCMWMGLCRHCGELKTFPLRPGTHNIELPRTRPAKSIFPRKKVDVGDRQDNQARCLTCRISSLRRANGRIDQSDPAFLPWRKPQGRPLPGRKCTSN